MSRVLMVDDAGLFQMLEGSFLRRTCWDIVRALDGCDLVETARQCNPDLILLDADRPAFRGAAPVLALKTDPVLRSIPVLVISSRDSVPRLRQEGADAILARPVVPGALPRALCSLGRVAHRQEERRTACVPVRIGGRAGGRRGRLKDISRTGLFLALTPPPLVQTPIDLTLRLPVPEGGARLRARGMVVRQVDADPDSHLIPGVGVRFVELDAGTESLIDRFVSEAILEVEPARPGTIAGRENA